MYIDKKKKLQDQEPIILCHVACSGGSMIYRMLIANFGLVGISEVSHRVHHGEHLFIPTDPEYALLEGGEIFDTEFENIFFDRIQHCNEICQKNNKPLIIREHTHSNYFFDSPHSAIPNNPSWIAGQYKKRLDKKVKCIVSVRDPIDSWLGLFANFNDSTPKDFHEYCAKYERFIRSFFENYDKKNMLLIKYEDIVDDQVEQLKRIAKFIDASFNGKAVNDWSQIPSTGNSGRQSKSVQKRVRRPFGIQLVQAADTSESYSYLVERLGYEHLRDSVSIEVKLRAYYVSVRKTFASSLTPILVRMHNWVLNKSRIP